MEISPLDSGPTSQILLKLGEMGIQLAVITEQLREVQDSKKDQELRIRSLERWRYSLPIALVLAIGSTATAVVSLYIR